MCAKLLQSYPTLSILWTAVSQAPLSMWFSRQEHWGGCHFLLHGNFPTQDQTSISYVSCIDRGILYHLGSPDLWTIPKSWWDNSASWCFQVLSLSSELPRHNTWKGFHQHCRTWRVNSLSHMPETNPGSGFNPVLTPREAPVPPVGHQQHPVNPRLPSRRPNRLRGEGVSVTTNLNKVVQRSIIFAFQPHPCDVFFLYRPIMQIWHPNH